MKIYIIFPFRDEAWGGGNQFLKALARQWREKGCLANSLEEADGFLFNSHHCLPEVFLARRRYPEKVFIHRLDGIMSLTRGDIRLDKKIFQVNAQIADATIFQSQWAKEKSQAIAGGLLKEGPIIGNAPDPELFFPDKVRAAHNPVRILASSWSTNPKKGFVFLKQIDERLDFSRYSVTFVGNNPLGFSNIRSLPPQKTADYARLLGEQDIYVFAGEDEACSNSLTEALHSGLPAVYLDSGSNREIVGKGGVSFRTMDELIAGITKVTLDYTNYLHNIRIVRIHEIADAYLKLFESVLQKKQDGVINPKITPAIQYYRFLMNEFFDRFRGKIKWWRS